MCSLKKIIHTTEEGIDRIKFKIKDQLALFDPVIIYPYRGFGTPSKVVLEGRILEKEAAIHGKKELKEGLWYNLKRVFKRYESDEIPGVEIEAELAGIKAQTVSDNEGYFCVEFKDLPLERLSNGWHQLRLRIMHLPFDVEFEEEANGKVLISDQQTDFGVISDVDDTIIKSNAMNPFEKLSIMLKNNATTRVAFENVNELYQELVNNGRNPLLFVSGSSYNLYDMLTAFCEHNDIPKAPLLLRNLGLNAKQWLKQDTAPYKKDHIERILSVYDRLSFILIGDSGQQDPEIYRDIHRENPGRVKAIYIRHLQSDKRLGELKEMAEELDIPFLLMEDSKDALQHARQMGWVA